MRRNEGYTILELLVVLAIMGLLTAAIPEGLMRAVDAAKFSGQVEDISLRLTAAHELAIESGDTIKLRANALSQVRMISISKPASSQIVFFSDGSSSGNVVVINYLGRHRNIYIDPITGLVRTQ